MSSQPLYRIETIAEYRRQWQLPKPEHPLISVIDMADINPPFGYGPVNLIFGFYTISLKRAPQVTFKYGQKTSDFDDGVLFFMSPGQLFGFNIDLKVAERPTGWVVQVHPDFLWGTALARSIRQYEFFSYSVNEALYLSEKEEMVLTGIAASIRQEYQAAIDGFTQKVIVAQLELLLAHAERFYQRQFITRKAANHFVLGRFEELVTAYFNSGALATDGLPGVAFLASELHMSPGYLSSLLKSLTGRSAQQHLHDRLIELAKEKLAATDLTVSEIAYELGFEHLASFSKLFKAQTRVSPVEWRRGR